MKVKKKFQYDGIELRIVEREEPYMRNSDATISLTRVMAPNGGTIPIRIKHKQTLKSIVEETTKTLDDFKKRGADIKTELTRVL